MVVFEDERRLGQEGGVWTVSVFNSGYFFFCLTCFKDLKQINPFFPQILIFRLGGYVTVCSFMYFFKCLI